MTRLNNADECLKAIEEWRKFSTQGQITQLTRAIEGLELDLMYYQGKESEKSINRCSRCLEILNKRLDTLSGE